MAGFTTRTIHALHDVALGAVVPRIHTASTFLQPTEGGEGPFEYQRGSNPTRTDAETTLAALEGVWLPADLWESVVLPARVADYRPAMLDELIASGEVVWQARPGDESASGQRESGRTGPGERGSAAPVDSSANNDSAGFGQFNRGNN